MTSYYNRPIATLPPVSSLPYPANLIVECSSCGLRAGCTRPVPGENIHPCRVMLVGEAPGRNEDEQGKPFCGQAGQYLDSLLFQSGIARESVCISNVVHCRPPGNRTPRLDEVKACSRWLGLELDIVQPDIVVALGATAIARFLGNGAGTVEHLHGRPVEKDGRIILPAYHPAAALRDTSKLRQCQEDFQVLRGLVKGRDWREYCVVDECPNPVYRVADAPELLAQMEQEIRESGEFAVDTEFNAGKLWSVQISAKEGTAWFIPIPPNFTGKFDLTRYQEYATAIVHYWFADIPYLEMTDRFIDTMTQAYLVGQSQGLKELASRLCGISMVTYDEMVAGGQQKLSLAYLQKAMRQKWPDPPVIEETAWDNRKGCLTTKVKKPWHISRKIAKLLDDYSKDNTTDLRDRWRSIPAEERAVVESTLGAMPESSLADIPFDEAVTYACRDSDATLRVHHRLQKMITDAGLDYIQYLDLGVLPQVQEMMQNGMPVDIPYLKELSTYYSHNMEAAAKSASEKIGYPFNPSSSKQVAEVVYSRLGFAPTRMTATGLISTDDQELKKINHPVVADILEYRRNLKNKSTFAEALVENAVAHRQGENVVHRVHTTLKTTRTGTGRLSSADPINLQTMPTRSEDGKKIRRGFKASPGYKLLAGDFSQQELRLQAHEAHCKNMLAAYRDGVDLHTLTASRIFGVSMEEAEQPRYRYPAKTLNFSVIYLVSAQGLYENIHEQALDIIVDGKPLDVSEWTVDSCQKLIDDWYRLNWEVKDWQMEKVAEARRFGYVRDFLGRIRYIPELSCPIRHIQEAGERMCVNFPIQGGCAGITKMAMLESYRSRNELFSRDDVRFIMAIHDELMLEVREDMVAQIAVWLKNIMDNVVMLDIPMVSEIKAGDNWAEMQKLKLEVK
ncbi:MAG: DNA polymerase [Sphaerochaeta sp.]|nr:DNA polymerase [Sphaerochaeta sp.]